MQGAIRFKPPLDDFLFGPEIQPPLFLTEEDFQLGFVVFLNLGFICHGLHVLGVFLS